MGTSSPDLVEDHVVQACPCAHVLSAQAKCAKCVPNEKYTHSVCDVVHVHCKNGNVRSGPAHAWFSNLRPGDPRNTQTCVFFRAAAAASSLSVTYPRSKRAIRIGFHSTDPTCKQTRTHPPVNTESSLFLFTSGTVDLRTFFTQF